MLRTIAMAGLALGLCLGGITNAQAERELEEMLWKTQLSLSYVKVSGNTNTETLSGKLEAKKEEEINRYYLKGNVLKTDDRGVETANKWLLEGRWERIFRERLFGFLTATYLSDKFSGYDYRIAAGPGLGYDIVKTEAHHLKGLLSVLYYYDRFTKGTKSSEDYAAGKAEVSYVWQIQDNLKFKQNADYLVSFEDTDNYFINSETALETRVNGHVSLGVSYILAYQNQVPSPEVDDTDRTFLTSVIIDY